MIASIEKWSKGKTPTAELAHATNHAISPQSIIVELRKAEDVTFVLLSDLRRFVIEFMEPIVASTPHIHSSILLFIPSETELSRWYRYLADNALKISWMCKAMVTNPLGCNKTLTGEFPAGATIFSGSDDETLRLWDARTGAAVGEVMEGHTHQVNCVAISLDNTTIVSGSADQTLRLWDARTGEAIGKAMEGHTDWVNCVAISPDTKTIVSASADQTLRLWDART
ncbi:POC1 centriolar protein A, partial [Tulasnella sp. JGI-2019a]